VLEVYDDVPDTCVGGRMTWLPTGRGFRWGATTNPAWSVTDNNDVAAFFDREWIRVD
jgi:hypothetical protein